MQPEKVKKGRRSTKPLRFIILWVIANGLPWVLYNFLESNYIFSEFWQIATLAGSISLVQYLLIRWQFKFKHLAWLPLSMMTAVLGTLIGFIFLENSDFTQVNLTLIALSLFALPSIPQAVLLRKHLQQAWLWILSNVTASTVFAMSLIMLDGGLLEAIASFGVYASVTGMTLLWLFGMSQEPDKLKNTAQAESRLGDSINDAQHSSESHQNEEAKTRYL